MAGIVDEIERFKKFMAYELGSNEEKKGDAWEKASLEKLVQEVYYHTGKLDAAVRDRNLDRVREHAADVANLAMMTLVSFEAKEVRDGIEVKPKGESPPIWAGDDGMDSPM